MKVDEHDVIEKKKRIVELEVERDNLNDEKTRLETKLKLEKEKRKKKTAKLKKAIVSKEKKWAEENEEIRKKCMKVEVEKRKLEIDFKTVNSDELLNKLRETKEVAERLYKSTQEKDNEIRCLMGKVEDEANKLILEEQKSLKLGKRIHALEETVALEAKKQKCYTKSTHVEKRMDEVQGMILDLLKRIDVCDKAKKDMQEKVSNLKKKEEEIKNEIESLFGRIELLEEEKKDMKEEVEQRKIDTQVYENVFNIEKKKMDVKFQEMKVEIEKREEEKREMNVKFQEMKTKIQKQEEEKKKMESKFMEVKEEMSVEVMAFEENKKVMELVGKIESLKREKMEMKAKLSCVEMTVKKKIEKILRNLHDKDATIKILMEENTNLENQKKELELEKNRLKIKIEMD